VEYFIVDGREIISDYEHGYPDNILDGCTGRISEQKRGGRVDRDYCLMFDQGKVSCNAGI
jgi:hypothetical protein